MLLLILAVSLIKEQVLSFLITLAVVEMRADCLIVFTTVKLPIASIPRMLDSDAVEDVSS